MHSCDRHDLRSFGWWVGKSSATRRQPAMLWKERLWILAHLEFKYHPWSTCLLPCLLFASVGQALGRIIASLP